MTDWVMTRREFQSRGVDKYGEERFDQETAWERPIRFGKNYVSNGVTLRLAHHFNGSGDGHVGFTAEDPRPHRWPHVTLGVSLPAERYDLRQELSERLQKLVDAFIAEKGLDRAE